MSDPKIRKKWLVGSIVSLFLVVAFLCVSLLLTSAFLFLKTRQENEKSSDGDFHLFQYVKLNEANNNTSSGFLTLKEGLKGEDFLSYEDHDGSHVLISDFESPRYTCTGSCYCDEGERRLSSGVAISKGLVYLVAAVTSLFAVSLAREHFNEVCEKDMLDQCPSHAVQAVVDECKPITKDDFDENGSIRKRYECVGNCVNFHYYDGRHGYLPHPSGEMTISKYMPNGMELHQYILLNEQSKNFDCSSLQFSKGYDTNFQFEDVEESMRHVLTGQALRKNVEANFMINELTDFCGRRSLVPTPIVSPFFKKNVKAQEDNQFPMCMGCINRENPSVKCIEKLM